MIFELRAQTKIFDNLELSNLRSVNKSISKNEVIKKNSINDLKSLMMLTKFILKH
jgi:hypothetical protein